MRLETPGNAEMEVGFEAMTEERDRLRATLLWGIVVLCTALVAVLAIGALYFVYLVVFIACLVCFYLTRYLQLLYIGDSAEAPSAIDHALVFCIITSAVVKISLPMACIAIDVLLFTYQF